jgi:hypothetical protein
MGCKPNFLYKYRHQKKFRSFKNCVLFLNFDRIFHNMEKLILVYEKWWGDWKEFLK